MGLGGCLDVSVKIPIAHHPSRTMMINTKTGAKARFGTPEFILAINTLGALSLALIFLKAL